jgi:hypothetical protein
MKSRIGIACATLLLAGTQNVVASAPRGSQQAEYPCDVIDMSFCFIKPWKSVVTLWSGPDFQVYNVATRDEEALFSVYDGMAPKQSDGRVRLKQYKRDGFRVDIGTLKNSDGNKTVDILIQSPRGGYLHVFGASDQAARSALADAMTSFRHCTRRGVTSVDCEAKPLFDESAAELVRNLK